MNPILGSYFLSLSLMFAHIDAGQGHLHVNISFIRNNAYTSCDSFLPVYLLPLFHSIKSQPSEEFCRFLFVFDFLMQRAVENRSQ